MPHGAHEFGAIVGGDGHHLHPLLPLWEQAALPLLYQGPVQRGNYRAYDCGSPGRLSGTGHPS